jgi:hypothetical protein
MGESMTDSRRFDNKTSVRPSLARLLLPGLFAVVAVLAAPWTAKANIRSNQSDFEKRVMSVRGQLKKHSIDSEGNGSPTSPPESPFRLSQYWNNWPNWGKMGGGWPNWPNWAKWYNY